MAPVHLYFFIVRYCLADDRLSEAVKFLDLGAGAGWELLQVQLFSCSLDGRYLFLSFILELKLFFWGKH